MSANSARGSSRTTLELLEEVSEEYGAHSKRDKLCVEDHITDDVASICIPPGGHQVLDLLEDRGLRVEEIPYGRPECHRAGHHKRVYVAPIGRRGDSA